MEKVLGHIDRIGNGYRRLADWELSRIVRFPSKRPILLPTSAKAIRRMIFA